MAELRAWGFVLAASLFIGIGPQAVAGRDDSLEAWLRAQENYSAGALFLNLSPPGTRRGVVIASPSRTSPDYFYHWVRDASLVMDDVARLYADTTDPDEKAHLYDLLMDFAAFSRENQRTFNLSGGLGEPKFYVDGRPYDQPWARPQNDGPAMRAITLSRFALELVATGQIAVVHERLYDSRLPAESVIKADLEYTAHHWRETSFDVWEEIRGMHFFTLLFQRKAMVMGAELADRMSDAGAASYYRQQAEQMQNVILRNWDEDRGYFMATMDRDDGIDYKYSGLDSAIVIAALRAEAGDGFLSPEDDRILATARVVEQSFEPIYAINMDTSVGTGIGRYPEDRYNGYITGSSGNPWFLATAAYAELYHRVANGIEAHGKIAITPRNRPFFMELLSCGCVSPGEVITRSDTRFAPLLAALRERGDTYFRRIRVHASRDGSLSEQINRDTGAMQGARDLTWSYASFLTAARARARSR